MADEREDGGFSSLIQSISSVPWLLNIPALSVLIFLRRRVGYRQLLPWMFLVNVLLIVSGSLAMSANPFNPVSARPPIYFAVVMFGYALWQRHSRWKDLLARVRLHTRSRGDSYIAKLLPWRREIIVRYVEPLAVILTGIVVGSYLSGPLGLWLIFAGLSLSIVEQAVFDALLERDLDVLDGMIDSEVIAEVANYYTRKEAGDNVTPLTLEQTGGVPTGIGDDLKEVIARRRQERGEAPTAPRRQDRAQTERAAKAEESASDIPIPSSPAPRKPPPDNLA